MILPINLFRWSSARLIKSCQVRSMLDIRLSVQFQKNTTPVAKRGFQKDCKLILGTLCSEIKSKSPVQYKAFRNLCVVSPSSLHELTSNELNKKFKYLLDFFVDNNINNIVTLRETNAICSQCQSFVIDAKTNLSTVDFDESETTLQEYFASFDWRIKKPMLCTRKLRRNATSSF